MVEEFDFFSRRTRRLRGLIYRRAIVHFLLLATRII